MLISSSWKDYTTLGGCEELERGSKSILQEENDKHGTHDSVKLGLRARLDPSGRAQGRACLISYLQKCSGIVHAMWIGRTPGNCQDSP